MEQAVEERGPAAAGPRVPGGVLAGGRPFGPPGHGANRATYPLPEGLAVLELPKTLSAESYEDLKAWIDVVLRLARRSVPGDKPKG